MEHHEGGLATSWLSMVPFTNTQGFTEVLTAEVQACPEGLTVELKGPAAQLHAGAQP